MSQTPRMLALALALFVGLSTPCAAALLAAPTACTMAGCGDGDSLGSPRPSCCCAPDGAPTDGGQAASLMVKVLADQGVQPHSGSTGTDLPFDHLDGFIAHPPSPVPLYLLHSALLN